MAAAALSAALRWLTRRSHEILESLRKDNLWKRVTKDVFNTTTIGEYVTVDYLPGD